MKLEDLINQHYTSLNQTDLHILKVIMQKGNDLEHIGIEKLAQNCHTSRTSILRMTKKLGFSGYSEFKNVLQWQKKKNNAPNHPVTVSAIMDDLVHTNQFLQQNGQLEAVVHTLKKAKRVFIYGTGQAQRYCAQELQRMFMQIDVYFYVLNATSEFKLAVSSLTEDDVMIVISLSGNARHILSELRLLRTKQVTVVSLTRFEDNVVAGLATFQLYAINTPVALGDGVEHHSFVPFFLIIEGLFQCYLQIMDNKEQ